MIRLLAFLFLFLGISAPLHAQLPPAPVPKPTPASSTSEIAPVLVERRRLFDIGPTNDTSAAARANRINRRLRNLIEGDADVQPFSPDNVRSIGGEEVVTLNDVSVLTVTQRDAEDAGQSARELALVQGTAMSRAVREARASRQNPLRGAGILISNSLRDLVFSFLGWLPRVFAALLLGVIFWMLARMARSIAKNATGRFGFDPNLRALVLALSFYLVCFVGFLAILSALGLDSSSLAAALGVSGFILGFAFKDILSHFLAGILLLISGKFRIGDQIVVREFEGTVERIELRALELRTYDNRLVIIPNADVFAAPITSNTASPHRRRSFTLTIPHNCDFELAQRLVVEAMKNTEGVIDEPEPDVLFDDLTAEAVVLRARFSTQSARSDYVRVGSDCMKNVKIAFRDARFTGHCES